MANTELRIVSGVILALSLALLAHAVRGFLATRRKRALADRGVVEYEAADPVRTGDMVVLGEDGRVSKAVPIHFVDLSCANCGHAPEQHYASRGQCYKCQHDRRCPEFIPKDPDASWVMDRDKPLCSPVMR